MLPFQDIPEHKPRNPVRLWAGFFPAHKPPYYYHPIVLVHAYLQNIYSDNLKISKIADEMIPILLNLSKQDIKKLSEQISIIYKLDDNTISGVYEELRDEWEFIYK